MDLLAELAGEPFEADAYDKLPASVKSTIMRHEWLWLSDKEKADLVTTECEPDPFD